MQSVTIPQALEMALAHHQAGRLGEAEPIYRQILGSDPQNAGAWHLLGVLAQQTGRRGEALAWIGKAIALNPHAAVFFNNLGNVLNEAGRREEAIAAYRSAVQLEPNCAVWHNNFGASCYAARQLDAALASFQRAVELDPGFADAYSNLGGVLLDRGQHAASEAALRQALQLNPCNTNALVNLGNVLTEQERHAEAGEAFQAALGLNPQLATAHNGLGKLHVKAGELEKGTAAFRTALALQPSLASAHNNLANSLLEQGQVPAAMVEFQEAIRLRPDFAEAHSGLGNALVAETRYAEAQAAFQIAIKHEPGHAPAYNNLGTLLIQMGDLDAAHAALSRAVELAPRSASAHSNLGALLSDQGELDAALESCRRSISLEPQTANFHSNLVFLLPFHPTYDAAAILAECRLWNDRHAEALTAHAPPHRNEPDPNRRLRIGYVSGNFCGHVVGRNLLPLMREHDHTAFEIVCYSSVPRPDPLTERFRGFADRWRETAYLSNAALAELIRRDEIDVLVDLALHMHGQHLLAFARCPAPVQVTFAGYPGTTGVRAIGYRLTDPWLDPVGSFDSDYSEESIRLADSFWCYDPLERDLTVNSLPALVGGVTFGCLNHFRKVNGEVLALWARVLNAVPGSRILILSETGSHRTRTIETLQQAGVAASRIEFVPKLDRLDYLRLYHRIDIALDTFPYNGHTTSLDALWMGVPVVTLAGPTVASRAGLSQLSNIGHPELIAHSCNRYVEIAAELARDLPRLAELRAGLRSRMEASPLMDCPRFARSIEASFREMWRRWCATRSKT